MAPRSFWKGYLKLSLVNCPVSMTPAITEREKVRFHTLSRRTGNRLVSQYTDAETGKPVEEEDEAKGYERAEGDYVILEDEELEGVALETTRTIDIEMFVPEDSIAWIWYDRPHYLKPEGEVGEEAFAVIREAMAATDMMGVSRLVMYRRERAVMLQPRGKGIVLWTLRYGDEVRDPADYFARVGEVKPDPDAMKLTKKLIDKRTTHWDPGMVGDPVQAKLRDIIAAKRKDRKPPPKAKRRAEAPQADNVVDIMEALRRSIAGEKKPTKKR